MQDQTWVTLRSLVCMGSKPAGWLVIKLQHTFLSPSLALYVLFFFVPYILPSLFNSFIHFFRYSVFPASFIPQGTGPQQFASIGLLMKKQIILSVSNKAIP